MLGAGAESQGVVRALRRDVACVLARAAAGGFPGPYYDPLGSALGASLGAPLQVWVAGVRDGPSRLWLAVDRGSDINRLTEYTAGGPCVGGFQARLLALGEEGEGSEEVSGSTRVRGRALQGSPSATATATPPSESVDVTIAIEIAPPAPLPTSVTTAAAAFNWQRGGQQAAVGGTQAALAALDATGLSGAALTSRRAAVRSNLTDVLGALEVAVPGLDASLVEVALLATPASADSFFVPVEPARSGANLAVAAAGAGPRGSDVGGGIAAAVIILGVAAAGALVWRRRQQQAAGGGAGGGAGKSAGESGGSNPMQASGRKQASGRGKAGDVGFDEAFGKGESGGGAMMQVHTNKLVSAGRHQSSMRGVLGGEDRALARRQFAPTGSSGDVGFEAAFGGGAESSGKAEPFEQVNPLARGKSSKSAMSSLLGTVPAAGSKPMPSGEVGWDSAGFSAKQTSDASDFSNPMARKR